MSNQVLGRIIPPYQGQYQDQLNSVPSYPSQTYPSQNYQGQASQGQTFQGQAYPPSQTYQGQTYQGMVLPSQVTNQAVPNNLEERLAINGKEKNFTNSEISVDPTTKETIITIKSNSPAFNINYSTKDGSYSTNTDLDLSRYGPTGRENKIVSQDHPGRYKVDFKHNEDGTVEYKIKLNSSIEGIKFRVGSETYFYKEGLTTPSKGTDINKDINNNLLAVDSSPKEYRAPIDNLSFGIGDSYNPKPNTGPILTLPRSLPKATPPTDVPRNLTEKSPPLDVKPSAPDKSPPVDVKPSAPDKSPPVDVKPSAPDKSPPLDVKPSAPDKSPPVDVKPSTPDMSPPTDIPPNIPEPKMTVPKAEESKTVPDDVPASNATTNENTYLNLLKNRFFSLWDSVFGE